ncbi:MAG: alkaline phosphatase [Thermoguttaceae bacterium]|nr:alkaline phosphatase [Thermoguttaceae bacterium]MDW8078002.1 alkaline phosphatase [Thermoguttaceae bacterium]
MSPQAQHRDRQISGFLSRWGSMALAVLALAVCVASKGMGQNPQSFSKAKNVIILVGDGAGYSCWLAAAMFLGRFDGQTGRTEFVVDGKEWLQLGCATYPLTLSTRPRGSGKQDPEIVYDPKKAWDPVEGYQWLVKSATDSAGAGTAMSTGRKTYNNAINWSDEDRPIQPTLVEIAKELGKSTGVVTSVQWSHATPATLGGAKVPKRDDYETIAQQMIREGLLDVIMGAGHPEYDNNGRPLPPDKYDYKYVGGKELWQALEHARGQPGGTYLGFRPVVTKEEFASLASGPVPPRVVGTAMVAATLQASRTVTKPGEPGTPQTQAGIASVARSSALSGSASSPSLGGQSAETATQLYLAPFAEPVNENVPTLEVMASGALNILDDNPNGFFLMIEGGAIDWANHANRADRMIEEMIDFLRTIETVVHWVESHSSWGETLVIITADHETGLIWGPQSDKVPFQPLEDRGPGRLPGLRYNATQHSNSLVPLYARGPGAEAFRQLIEGEDPVRGPFVHLTSIFYVAAQALTGQPVQGNKGQ